MSKQEIIQELANNNTIHEIVNNITKAPLSEDELDFIQDLYINLLEKDDKVIEDLYNKNQLKFFITRIVLNNLRSVTSPFYYKYRRWTSKKQDIDETNTNKFIA